MACRQSRMEFIRVLLLKLASWLLRLLNTKKRTSNRLLFTNVLNYKKVLNDHSLDVSLVHDMQTDKAEVVGLTGQDMPYYGSWFNVNEAPDVFTHVFLLYVNGLCCHLWEELIIHLRIGIC